MAIENQAAVRGTHRAHHHAAGASKAVAGEDTGAASGFSALLGAAADDTDALGSSRLSNAGTTSAGLPADALTSPGQKRAPAGDSGDSDSGVPAGSDAAALAAWAGLLQPATVPLAPAVAAVPATGTLVAAAPEAFAGQAAGATDFSVPVRPGVPMQGAGEPTRPGSLLQVDGKPPGRTTAADAASTLATAPATVSADSLAPAAQSAPALMPNPAAAPMTASHPVAAPALRPAAVGTLAAAGRAHPATVAADAASNQATSLSAGAVTVAVGGAEAGTARGASSTVSMGEGGQGRWAGMLSDIVRPVLSDGAAGGFAGGASQGQERGQQGNSSSPDGSGATIHSPGFATMGGSADASSGFAAASIVGGDGQPLGSGMVMTPDEWLAATTAPVNPRSLQTAELTVDAFGSPVDVKISLNGSEAQVAFQSDQADTRALLGGAVSDLQNLLQQEGLMLSGVSVGGSNAGQAGNARGFDGDASQGGNRARGGETIRIAPDVSLNTPTAAASARSAAATARGGLDLYA